MTTLLELLLAPALVGLATLAARRWNPRAGGIVSAFPAIVGPTLLITATAHGGAFAARAATGTLMGLAGLAAFAAVFGRLAPGTGWPGALLGGWAAAAVATALVAGAGPDLPAALAVAVLSLAAAYASLPGVTAPRTRAERLDVGTRMVLTLVLVTLLAAAADRFGALAGGVLAALPVLASVLAVATLRTDGPAAAVALLRGMLAGMGSFVAFCATIALLAASSPLAVAFAVALLAALVLHGLALRAATA